MFAKSEVVIKNKETGVSEEYTFYFDGTALWLDVYVKRIKEGRKTISTQWYSRLSARDSHIEEKDVPLTEEIKQMAIDNFVKNLEVKKWSER